MGGFLITACSNFLEPELDNRKTEGQLLENPAFAEGLLMHAYWALPDNYNFNLDVASDDAVTNDKNSNFLQMATGSWKSSFNPLSQWNNAYEQIQYINDFLEKMDQVAWSSDNPQVDKLHRLRLTGEAHGLRAWYQFQLLQAHAGETAESQLLGFPIVTNSLMIDDNLKLPRNTFQECVDQIMSDCDVAIANLTASYTGSTGISLPAKVEAEDYDDYNDSNSGNTGGQYRTDDVDIEVSSAGGYNVGWTADGEWLQFSIARIYNGTYTLDASIASGGANPGSLKVSVGTDPNNLTDVVELNISNTGGWQNWQTFSAEGIKLGNMPDAYIRFTVIGGGFNMDWFEFKKTDGPVEETAIFNGEEYSLTDFEIGMGGRWLNRFTGNSARALKARTALYAASPAYEKGSNVDWAQAASLSGELLKAAGGIRALSPSGLTFYQSNEDEDIIWGRSQVKKSSWEQDNFPPSLFGQGRTNPTQELVNAFPMANGYPIDHPMSGYDPATPYVNRDSRLTEYIVYNGNTLKNAISTHVGAEKDGINELATSTRTGYYLRKFMDEGVNLVAGSSVTTQHRYVLLRMTEVFLNYAEAANEAWGPDADPNGYGFTARDVIGAIRNRAGIVTDDYLTSLASTEDLRSLIQNERRLELSFEGHRFWDLRRWNMTFEMAEPVSGIFISADGLSSEVKQVEERAYSSFMIYGPIPFNETLKYNIAQNKGW